MFGEEFREGFAQASVGGHDLQGRAREQRHDDLPYRRVEAQRGELEDTVAGPGPEGVGEGAGQGGQSGVGDGHALGPAGGAGGVDDVRRRVGPLGAPEAGVAGGPGVRAPSISSRGTPSEAGVSGVVRTRVGAASASMCAIRSAG